MERLDPCVKSLLLSPRGGGWGDTTLFVLMTTATVTKAESEKKFKFLSCQQSKKCEEMLQKRYIFLY